MMNLSPEELRYISQTIFKHNTSPAKKLWPPEHHQDATANACIAPPACNPEEKWRRSLYADFGFQREDIVLGMEDQFCYWKIEEALRLYSVNIFHCQRNGSSITEKPWLEL